MTEVSRGLPVVSASVDSPRVLVGTRLARAFVEHPFRRRAASAVLARPVGGAACLSRAFDQGIQRCEELVLGQPPPFQHADATRPRGQVKRRFPDAGELRHDHRRFGEEDDDFRRFAADELERSVVGFLLFDRRREAGIEIRDQLFVPLGHIHI